MYLPKHFEQHDPAALQGLMRAHPLAALVSSGPQGLTADHLPLEFDPGTGPHGTLFGHVARANPLWRLGRGQGDVGDHGGDRTDGGDGNNGPDGDHGGTPVLAIFRGPQAYISPSYYPSKALTHKVVPTWNYAVVHAHGLLRAVDDAPWLHTLVSRLTGHHEAGQAVPWAVHDAPDDYVQQMLRAIVGIQITLTRVVGKWKISQNRSADDRAGVADGLLQWPDDSAAAMAALVRPLAPSPTSQTP